MSKLSYARASFQLPPRCRICNITSTEIGERKLDLLVVKSEVNNEYYHLAVNSLLGSSAWENKMGRLIDDDILKAATPGAAEPPYLVLSQKFAEVSGRVSAVRTFCFGEFIFCHLAIAKQNGKIVDIIFYPHRRNRQALTLADEKVLVKPEDLFVGWNGRNFRWNGKNF